MESSKSDSSLKGVPGEFSGLDSYLIFNPFLKISGYPLRGEPLRAEPLRGEPLRGEPLRAEPFLPVFLLLFPFGKPLVSRDIFFIINILE